MNIVVSFFHMLYDSLSKFWLFCIFICCYSRGTDKCKSAAQTFVIINFY